MSPHSPSLSAPVYTSLQRQPLTRQIAEFLVLRLQMGCRDGNYSTCQKTGRIVGGIMQLAFGMVGARGFEPPTFCSQSRRTTRLCNAPNHWPEIIPHFPSVVRNNV